jgi:hypothetical protein
MPSLQLATTTRVLPVRGGGYWLRCPFPSRCVAIEVAVRELAIWIRTGFARGICGSPVDRIGNHRSTICGLLLPAALMVAAPLAAQGDTDWTVVTLARDGSWGVGTSELQGTAIASALRKCNAKSRVSDCGAEFTAVRKGWTLGILCGDHRVLVAATELATAVKEAQARESTLRTLYGDGLPGCRRVITVDPDGSVIASKVSPPAVTKVGPGK